MAIQNPLAAQQETTDRIRRLLNAYVMSNSVIRPHFFLTGPSGSGKTAVIEMLTYEQNIKMVEINAAALTKEGLSGNSLSKALAPIREIPADGFGVVFVDEFDKLFISGNTNGELAHESTNGVQNEFLTVLEKGYTAIFGDYGKYVEMPVGHLLFVFAGAFNNETGINHEWLRKVGVKTEFLGRVPLIYSLPKIELADILALVDNYELLLQYFELEDTQPADQAHIIQALKDKLTADYEVNTLGIRYLSSLVHQYFINGTFDDSVQAKKIVSKGAFKRPTATTATKDSTGLKTDGTNTTESKAPLRKRLSKASKE